MAVLTHSNSFTHPKMHNPPNTIKNPSKNPTVNRGKNKKKLPLEQPTNGARKTLLVLQNNNEMNCFGIWKPENHK
jgi:hypothetical protein